MKPRRARRITIRPTRRALHNRCISKGSVTSSAIRALGSPAPTRAFPYATFISALFLLLLTPLATDHLTKAFGLTLAAPVTLLGAASGLALALTYWRYVGILAAGSEPLGSLERRAYDALRASLATGGLPARLYSRWLTHFLDAVDRFFGDAGRADQTLFPHAFGLRAPAPLWTAPAFDRCLLLALIYPIVTIFVIWAISNHVGPAEEALGLKLDLPGWRRGLLVAGLGFTMFAGWRAMQATGWKYLAWIVVAVTCAGSAAAADIGDFAANIVLALISAAACAAARAMAGVVGDVGARRIAFAGTFAVAVAFAAAPSFSVIPYAVAVAVTVATIGIRDGAGPRAIAVAVALALVELSVAAATADNSLAVAAIVFLFALIGTIVGVGVAVGILSDIAVRNRRHGVFLSLFFVTMILTCLIAARLPSVASAWPDVSPLLLFLGLLTLLNAPFDWASLGLTRALLRRGLELGGWWPYLLALVDALLAGVLIALLALTMVIGVQSFDAIAVRRGGQPVLPLVPLFDDLAAHPEAPEYWWIYALLLSTMIPSLVNLVIGGTALTRAAPGLPSLLLQKMPAGRSVPAFDRAWVALVLTLQVVGGVILGVAAQALLVVGLIRYVMPWAGLGLLDMARAVAAFDLPARVGALF
jgi:hypothetical protein